MKIRIVSDLHLEFYGKNEYYLPKESDENDTILILAGDIIAGSPSKYRYFFEDVHSRFKHTIYICGNHEYYRGSIIRIPEKINDMLSGLTDKIHFGENKTTIINDIVFVYATLWTDFNNGDAFSKLDADLGMNDFRLIRTGTKKVPYRKKFKADDSHILHKLSVGHIFGETLKYKDEGKKVVVVSHHGPSFQLVHPIYKNNNLNGCYYSNLDEEIERSKPNLWIFGHTHMSTDMMIHQTRCVSNPFGYFNHEENPDFDPFLSVNL